MTEYSKNRFKQLAGIIKESKEEVTVKEARIDPYDDWKETQTADMFKRGGYSEETQRRAAILVHSLLNAANEIDSLQNMIKVLISTVEDDIEAGVPDAQKLKSTLTKLRVNRKLLDAVEIVHDVAFAIEP